MQFQVPQFIETEDRIVGPLTLRQFLYVGAAAVMSFFLYFSVAPWLWFALSLPLFVVGAALGFIKINGQPLIRILFSAASFYWKPQIYVWQPEHPELPKNHATIESVVGNTIPWQKIIMGLTLKRVREEVQTGTKVIDNKASRAFTRTKERYEIFKGIAGDQRAARRIDYR